MYVSYLAGATMRLLQQFGMHTVCTPARRRGDFCCPETFVSSSCSRRATPHSLLNPSPRPTSSIYTWIGSEEDDLRVHTKRDRQPSLRTFFRATRNDAAGESFLRKVKNSHVDRNRLPAFDPTAWHKVRAPEVLCA